MQRQFKINIIQSVKTNLGTTQFYLPFSLNMSNFMSQLHSPLYLAQGYATYIIMHETYILDQWGGTF